VKGRLRLAAATLLLGLTLPAGCGRDPDDPPVAGLPPHVVLVTIDTLRADRLGRGFTPTLDELAAGGLHFSQARANVPLTLPSHATIMTGLLPPAHGVRENGLHRLGGHDTLASILGKEGFATGAVVGAFVLARPFGLDEGFEEYDDNVPRDANATSKLEAERTASTVTDAALRVAKSRLSERHDAPSRRLFLWAHYYDPHAPYEPPKAFRHASGGSAYDGEVAYVDAELRRLLSGLAELAAREVIVIVAGDHGESLGEHGESTHGMLLFDGALRVPLIFSVIAAEREPSPPAPGSPRSWRVGALHGRAGRVDDPVSLVDVAPTLLAGLGIRAQGRMDGRNLLSPDGRAGETYAETEYPRVAGWSPLVALIADGQKLIRGGRSQLFDIARDPAESRDLQTARPGSVAGMEARLAEISSAARRPVQVAPSEEVRERLRSLGYVTAPAGPAPTTSLPDASDRIGEWTAFEAACASLSVAETRRAAIASLEKLVSLNPRAQAFHTTLARALGEDGRRAEALRYYREAVSRWPADPTLLHDLAVAAREAGELDEALRAERAALSLDPDNAAAHDGVGLLNVAAGRPAEAIASFQRALELDQGNPAYAVNLGNARNAAGDRTGAREAYERALSIDTGWPDAANGLAVLLVQEGRPADAIRWLELALQRSPGFVEARLNLGIACQEAGRNDCARANYRSVLAAGPGHQREKGAARDLIRSLGQVGR
jgi:arylsulfatase A-like enzyme/Flp pilus assembly protein TadD